MQHPHAPLLQATLNRVGQNPNLFGISKSTINFFILILHFRPSKAIHLLHKKSNLGQNPNCFRNTFVCEVVGLWAPLVWKDLEKVYCRLVLEGFEKAKTFNVTVCVVSCPSWRLGTPDMQRTSPLLFELPPLFVLWGYNRQLTANLNGSPPKADSDLGF